MTTQEKARLIIQDIVSEKGNNPVRIFKNIAKKEYISIHGPEHEDQAAETVCSGTLHF